MEKMRLKRREDEKTRVMPLESELIFIIPDPQHALHPYYQYRIMLSTMKNSLIWLQSFFFGSGL